MKVFAVIGVIVLTVGVAHSALPPTFKKCNRKDADFRKCLKEAIEDALGQVTKPFDEINLPIADPLFVTSLTVKGGGGQVAVDQHFTDCYFHGFSKTKINDYNIDFDLHTMKFDQVVPELVVKCQYEMDGKILLLPVKGKGNSTLVFKNAVTKGDHTFKIVTKRNKSFIVLDKVKILLEPEQVEIKFDNLFDGNKELGENLNKILNENSKEIYQEVKPDYEELMSQVYKTICNQVFSKISIEEAFE